MKKLKFLIVGLLLFVTYTSKAHIPVNVKFGSPPQWGPIGYSNIRYYYLPDVECYYDIQLSKFLYHNGFSWIRKSDLPFEHRNYDLYSGYKVVMTDYQGNKPYFKFYKHIAKYAKGYQGLVQSNIGNKPPEKNFISQIKGNNLPNKKIHNNNGWRTSAKHEIVKIKEEPIIIEKVIEIEIISENSHIKLKQ